MIFQVVIPLSEFDNKYLILSDKVFAELRNTYKRYLYACHEFWSLNFKMTLRELLLVFLSVCCLIHPFLQEKFDISMFLFSFLKVAVLPCGICLPIPNFKCSSMFLLFSLLKTILIVKQNFGSIFNQLRSTKSGSWPHFDFINLSLAWSSLLILSIRYCGVLKKNLWNSLPTKKWLNQA